MQGSCAKRVETKDMSEEEKHTWSVRCGARFVLSPVHVSSVGGCGMHTPGGHVQQQEGVVIVMLAPRVVCGAES